MSPKELKHRQSQHYKAVMDRQPTRLEFNWTCPNCGGSRYKRNYTNKATNNPNFSGWWYNSLCDNHVPSKEDVVRHMLKRVR